MRVITPQRQLIGTDSKDMRVETDRMLTRLAFNANDQAQSTGTFVDGVAPTPLPDGTRVVFTLPSAPSPALSLQLFAGPALRLQGATSDYTLNAKTVTFKVAPLVGVPLTAWYRTQ